MIPKKPLIVCLLLGLGGGVVMVRATSAVHRLEARLRQSELEGQVEGESFIRTLQGLHAQRQLKAFDDRRTLAMQLTAARRDRFLGLFAVAAATLGLIAAAIFRRIAAEVDEARRFVQGEPPRP